MNIDLLNAIRLEIEYQQKLLKRIVRRSNELAGLPNNNLIATNSKGRIQYYLTRYENRKEIRKYLGKKDEALRKSLQEKRYLEKAAKHCRKNIEMLELIWDSFLPTDPEEAMASEALAYHEQEQANQLVYGYQSDTRWKQRKLSIKNGYPLYRPEELKHTAIDGTVTRTKSEAHIINLLVSKGLPYVYELPRKFCGRLKSPDFTVYDRKHNREILIEHMGRMDLDSYRENQYDKLGLYIASGWVPNVNLLLTFDDADGKINIPAISRAIDSIIGD